MKLVGSRVIGLLLVWMAIGFLADAALTDLQAETLEDIGGPSALPTDERVMLVTGGVGLGLLLVGLVLLVRKPGPGMAPGAQLGREASERKPSRCWRCRASWPAHEDACPACGAEWLH